MSNNCQCINPPGGSVTCPDGHTPVCRVIKGVAHGICYPPQPTMTTQEFRVWIFAQITGLHRQRLSSADEEILRSGTYVDKKNDAFVSFRLPNTGEFQPPFGFDPFQGGGTPGSGRPQESDRLQGGGTA